MRFRGNGAPSRGPVIIVLPLRILLAPPAIPRTVVLRPAVPTRDARVPHGCARQSGIGTRNPGADFA